MPKHKNSDILRKLQDISQLIQENKSDEQIMGLLDIPQRTLTRYKQRIHEQNKEIWADIVKYEIYGEYLRLKASLEHTYQTALKMAEDPERKTLERLESLEVKDEARTMIVQMLINGPSYIQDAEEEDVTTTPSVTVTPILPRPTDYPTIPDPKNPGKWATDPRWIAENIRKVMSSGYKQNESK